MDNVLLDKKVLNIDKSTWQLTKLGDLLEDISQRVDNPSLSGYDRFVGLEHFVSGDIKIKNWGTADNLTSSTKAFKAGDILFARRNAYLRRASLVDFNGCCSGDAFVLRENHDKVVPGFTAFVMNSNALWDYANQNAAGTMSQRVKWRDLANYEFLLPPKEQQAQLAELLWSMDEVIEREREVIEKLNIGKISVQKSLFSNPEFQSSIIFEVASVKRGKFTPRPRNDPKYFGGDIPFIQTAEVIATRDFIKNYSQTLNEIGLSVSKMFPKGTIVMVIAGTYVGSVGMLDFDSAFTDSLLGIQAYPKVLNQKYLFYYMQFKEREIDSLATEVAQRNLSIETFKDFQIKYPISLEIQSKIVSDIDALHSSIMIAEQKVDCSKSLQKSFINQIF